MKTRLALFLCFSVLCFAQARKPVPLPSGKVLLSPAPGEPQAVGSFPQSVALSPDGRYLAILDGGYGRLENRGRQGIGVLDLRTNRVEFYPDDRLRQRARQTYFLGLAFSSDGTRLYASMASLTDPLGTSPGSTGNGIAVYRFQGGRVSPERFLPIAPPLLPAGKRPARAMAHAPAGTAVPYPAGLAAFSIAGREQLLVADNMSDDAVQIDAASGKTVRRFDLSMGPDVPTSYPYTVVVNRAGTRAWCSLWNGSRVAELDLQNGQVTRYILLRAPATLTGAGSHPTAMLLSPSEQALYVALANSDEIAVIDAGSGQARYASTRLPRQRFPGSYPIALAQNKDGSRLFVANAGSDAVGVFAAGGGNRISAPAVKLLGFIPTEWYPAAVAVHGDDLLIASGKAQGTGPNSQPLPPSSRRKHPYIASLLHGSIARVSITGAEKNLRKLTAEVAESNLMNGRAAGIRFKRGRNPIKHVIYVIKENRTYDQVFGDLGVGDSDPSLVMYGEAITPNQHELARRFGVLDNFYDSGEISGNGHVWSTAAIDSDYTERTWPVSYRGAERTYDYEGMVADEIPLEQRIPDVDEPGSGYLWANAARQGIAYRHYGEYIVTRWCDDKPAPASPQAGPPLPPGQHCPRSAVRKGEPLPGNVGDPHGSPSPYDWPVPLPARNQATKPELRDHFDPYFPDFRLDYPDQLRADEFLNEFRQFVRDGNLPILIVLRLPDDHTAGARPGYPRPEASVADNDLAVGRVVEAVSRSAYWDDTAILVLEDDAQDGADHVDAHRSIALLISKYAPRQGQPFLDHHFYTTVNMIRTIEALLGLPPMNNNDAQAALMAPLFSGDGGQPAFTSDYRNRDNGLIYQANPPGAQGAAASLQMDFSRADAVDSAALNRILWRQAKGDVPMPEPRHVVIPVR